VFVHLKKCLIWERRPRDDKNIDLELQREVFMEAVPVVETSISQCTDLCSYFDLVDNASEVLFGWLQDLLMLLNSEQRAVDVLNTNEMIVSMQCRACTRIVADIVGCYECHCKIQSPEQCQFTKHPPFRPPTDIERGWHLHRVVPLPLDVLDHMETENLGVTGHVIYCRVGTLEM